MKRQVVFTDAEWRKFRIRVGCLMHSHSQKSYGFKVVDREIETEITERLEDWFVGVVSMVFDEAEREE